MYRYKFFQRVCVDKKKRRKVDFHKLDRWVTAKTPNFFTIKLIFINPQKGRQKESLLHYELAILLLRFMVGNKYFPLKCCFF